jgi:hypothetical protein
VELFIEWIGWHGPRALVAMGTTRDRMHVHETKGVSIVDTLWLATNWSCSVRSLALVAVDVVTADGARRSSARARGVSSIHTLELAASKGPAHCADPWRRSEPGLVWRRTTDEKLTVSDAYRT